MSRILTWHIPNAGVSLPSYYMETDYTPTNVRISAQQAGAEDFEVDILDDGVTIFANQTPTLTIDGEVLTTLGYNTLATSTFSVGEFIDGGSSSAQAQIVESTGGNLKVRMTTDAKFQDAETITGATNLATALVISTGRGYPTRRFDYGTEKTVATLHGGDTLEEAAEYFPDSIAMIEEGSVVTCVPKKTGGAIDVTVHLELE